MLNLLQSGVASAERVFELLDAEEEPVEQAEPLTEGGRGEVAFDHVTFRYEPGQPVIDDVACRRARRQRGRDRRADRRRQDDPGEPDRAVLRPRAAAGSSSTASTSRRSPRRTCGPDRRRAAGDVRCSATRIRDNIAYGRPDAIARRRSRRPPGSRTPTSSSTTCRTATTRWSASGAAASPAASGSGWPSPGPSWPTPGADPRRGDHGQRRHPHRLCSRRPRR